jgi:hypothetical protein
VPAERVFSYRCTHPLGQTIKSVARVRCLGRKPMRGPALHQEIANSTDRSRFNLEHRKQCSQMTHIESRFNHKTAALPEPHLCAPKKFAKDVDGLLAELDTRFKEYGASTRLELDSHARFVWAFHDRLAPKINGRSDARATSLVGVV